MSPILEAVDATASAARQGLTAPQKSLPPWLFYDERGSHLFEQITELPEYYLTRTERAIFEQYAHPILSGSPQVTIVELGAGTATKTGILLREAVRQQGQIVYQPIDISPSALEEARDNIGLNIPGVTVRPQVANYITEPYSIQRKRGESVLTLYIGSSIGNFSPEEARGILLNLRRHLHPGDSLLLGTDLAPSTRKTVQTLLAAYADAQGVTAAFNRNILIRLNRDLGADFNLDCFRHEARWNPAESRIEMHLVSIGKQTVRIPANSTGAALTLQFAEGETIHTENSYKFSQESIADLLAPTGFLTSQTFEDPNHVFAVTLAEAI